nr:putative zinc finger, CCHC-type [Tanacetum cinerariifolium]
VIVLTQKRSSILKDFQVSLENCQKRGHFARNYPDKKRSQALIQALNQVEPVDVSDLESLYSLDDEPSDSVLCTIAYSELSSDDDSDTDSLEGDFDFGVHMINPIPHVLPIQEDPPLPLAKIHLLADFLSRPKAYKLEENESRVQNHTPQFLSMVFSVTSQKEEGSSSNTTPTVTVFDLPEEIVETIGDLTFEKRAKVCYKTFLTILLKNHGLCIKGLRFHPDYPFLNIFHIHDLWRTAPQHSSLASVCRILFSEEAGIFSGGIFSARLLIAFTASVCLDFHCGGFFFNMGNNPTM